MRKLNIFQLFESRDERVQFELANHTSKLYPMMLILAICVLLYKLIVLDLSYQYMVLEMLAVVSSLGYYFIRVKIEKLGITYSKDEFIRNIQNTYLYHSCFIAFYIMIIGEFLLMFVFKDYFQLQFLFLDSIIWTIPAIILAFMSVKKGLVLLGTKKEANSVLKKFKKRVALGSLFYGVTMNWDRLVVNHALSLKGITHVMISAILWGVPFYWIMKTMFQLSETQADKSIEFEK